MKKRNFFCSQAPHVPRNVEDETKYVELMVINDHLMVSLLLHVHVHTCFLLFTEFYFHFIAHVLFFKDVDD